MLVVYLTSHCSTDHWLRIWEEGRLVRLKYRDTLSFLSLCCFVIYVYKNWTHCSVYEQWGGSRALARKDIGKGVGWVGTSKIPTNYFPWLTGPPPLPPNTPIPHTISLGKHASNPGSHGLWKVLKNCEISLKSPCIFHSRKYIILLQFSVFFTCST